MPGAADATTEARQGSSVATPKRGRIGTGRKRSRRSLLRVVVPLAALVLLLLLAVGWLTFRAMQVKDNLEAATQLLPTMQSAITEGNIEEATTSLEEIVAHTAEARGAGTDPLWRAAGLLPWLGQNFAAVTDVTVAADVVVSAAAPVLDAIGPDGLGAFVPQDGEIELQALQELSPKLTRAASTADAAHESLLAIDEEQLLPQLSRPVVQATSALDAMRQSLDGASAAAEVLPAMLGADGERNYLILVQNNAEVRATGGIPGALVVLKTSNGEIEFTDHGSASDLGRFNPPFEVDEEQEKIYSTRIGGFMQSVNLTPDFPTAATTAQKMWEEKNRNSRIDGVLAIDPVVLSYLLEATGPVDLRSLNELPVNTGQLPLTLTAENVAETLLSDVYREVEEPSAQDAYFAAVAGDVFSGMTSGDADPVKLIKAVQRSMEEQRLFVWSETESEQEIIGNSVLGGSVSTEEPTIGVYFNDGTGAKMDYYVRREVRVIQRCEPDGYYRYAVEAKLTNTAPADAAEVLPDYVTGGGVFGVEPGTVRTNVYAYGPGDWLLDSAVINGEAKPFGSYRHDGHPVGASTVSLKPGESTTVAYEFATPFATEVPQLRVTPTIQPSADVIKPSTVAPDCDGGR